MNPVHQLLLVGPDQLVVDVRANERGGSVADPDHIRARLQLLPREAQLHLDHEREQVANEGGVSFPVAATARRSTAPRWAPACRCRCAGPLRCSRAEWYKPNRERRGGSY